MIITGSRSNHAAKVSPTGQEVTLLYRLHPSTVFSFPGLVLHNVGQALVLWETSRATILTSGKGTINRVRKVVVFEGPATSSGHRNPPRHIPDYENSTFLSETRFAPPLAISSAFVMSEFECEHIRKPRFPQENFQTRTLQVTELFFQPMIVLFPLLVESALISSTG